MIEQLTVRRRHALGQRHHGGFFRQLRGVCADRLDHRNAQQKGQHRRQYLRKIWRVLGHLAGDVNEFRPGARRQRGHQRRHVLVAQGAQHGGHFMLAQFPT